MSTGSIIKKGKFWDDNMEEKEMDPTGITRIVKISIYHSDKIHGLTVYFERNGTKHCTDRWGGSADTMTEVNLKTNEYITSVKGYVDFKSQDRGIYYVRSLVLKTNLSVYGPYGWERGEPFEFPARGGQIIGFHAYCRKDLEVNALGVYVRQSTGSIIKEDKFQDRRKEDKEMDPTGITRIVKISIYHSNAYINGLTVDFERNGTKQCTDRWGGSQDTMTEVNLKTNEYITSVKGYVDFKSQDRGIYYVRSLVLKTNLSVYGPYGWEKGESFEFPTLGGQIIGFHAYCRKDFEVNALGVYVRQEGHIIKEGPFLGGGRTVKHMYPTGITRIVKISIYHSDKIHGLTLYFERDGTTQCTGLWGGNEGTSDEINLETNEYIKSVKGHLHYDGVYLKSLVLETNLHTYGRYGKEEGESFEHTSLHGHIIGFFALFGINNVFNNVGVYIKGPSKSVLCGGSGGFTRDMDPKFAVSSIDKVIIRYSDTIDALSVCYKDYTTESNSLWGGNTGKPIEIKLKSQEYIKGVRGYIGYFGDIFIVRSLQLITSETTYGPYGKEEGTPFELSAFDGKIIGFHGRSEAYLNAIGVYVQWPDSSKKIIDGASMHA